MKSLAPPPRRGEVGNYVWSVVIVALSTLTVHLMLPWFAPENLILIYLVGVVFVAGRFGRGPSVLASFLSVASFDFLFVPPFYSLAVDDTQYLFTFAIMLAVALLTGTLVMQLRLAAEASTRREERMATLYRMSREFSRAATRADIVWIAEKNIGDLLAAEVWVLLPQSGRLAGGPGVTSAFPLNPGERQAAEWSLASGQAAGRGAAYFSDSLAFYVPLVGTRGVVGVLGIYLSETPEALTPGQRDLIGGIAGQLALTLERMSLAEEAERSRVEQEAERFRNVVLSSISHDLRTPLATIAGASSGLLEDEAAFDPPTRREMIQSIWDEADRLNRLVTDLLDMSRLESGALVLRKEWHSLDEIVGAALTALKRRLGERPVTTQLAPDLPLISIDGLLIEQVLVNLIDNAIKHSGPEGPITIRAAREDREIRLSVEDLGPGLLPGREEEVFSKFHRAAGSSRDGVGLGLAICRGFVEAHGGRIRAENRPEGGAVFTFTLPLTGPAPAVAPELPDEDGSSSSQEAGAPAEQPATGLRAGSTSAGTPP